MTYSEKLKDPRWQKKRLLVMQRDGFKCRFCMDTTTTLHIHHLQYQGDPWEINDEYLIILCEHCHVLAEYLKSDDHKIKIIRVKKKSYNSIIQLVVVFNYEDFDGIAIYKLYDGLLNTDSLVLTITVETWNEISRFVNL